MTSKLIKSHVSSKMTQISAKPSKSVQKNASHHMSNKIFNCICIKKCNSLKSRNFENWRTSKFVWHIAKHWLSEMKIQSKILSTLKKNYRNTSMSSQTSKVFSDFKKWPRNLSKITSSEKSPKSQRSSPQQICQGECFAPYVKQNFQMHRYQKMQ